eukprot:UN31423
MSDNVRCCDHAPGSDKCECASGYCKCSCGNGNACKNGGQCMDGVCHCPEGWEGADCSSMCIKQDDQCNSWGPNQCCESCDCVDDGTVATCRCWEEEDEKVT